MNDNFMYSVGGVKTYTDMDYQGLIGDSGTNWNFGVLPKTPEVQNMIMATPTLYQRFPNLQGKWDGKSRVNHHDAVRRVLGKDIDAQMQPAGTCFLAGTMVITRRSYNSSVFSASESYGSVVVKKPIELVTVGDLVLTHTGNYKPVTRVYNNEYKDEIYKISCEDYEQLPVSCTKEHPFYVKNGDGGQFEWKAAKDIVVGDTIKYWQNGVFVDKAVTIIHKVGFIEPITVYNLEVEGDNSYVADNFVVHNCGGRAGSQGLDVLQCILIASGKRAKFHRTSHAALYYFARRKYNMLRGGDGVAGGSIPEIMAEMGCVQREEVGDLNYYGDGSDDLAVAWGGGRISPELKNKMDQMAKDNLVTSKVRATSAEECADGLASGGVVVQSDNQGYTMTRDSEGVCSARGQWGHYQIRTGVGVTPRGRKVFDYNQSWGRNTPDGPLLPGCPDNCFGVEWDVQDRLCRNGEVDIIFGFDLWDLESGNIDIDWIY